jgi:hypothetical protein
MSTLGRTRLRLAADAASFDAPLDVLRRATPQFWRGNDVQFEISAFFNGALLDVSNLASLTLEVRPLGANGHAPDPSFAPLMGATVTTFDNTTTLDNWNAGTNQQALVVFTAAQSNIAAGAAWLSIFAITNDSPGRVITLCAGPVRVLEDGAGLATTPTPTADTFYTAAESDARYAPIGAGSGAAPGATNPLMDGTAAPGTATPYSRADHVHPSDTSRAAATHASQHGSGGSDPVTIAESQVTNLTSDLAAKAPLASPALTGTPTAPTVAGASDSSTKLATTAFVQAAIAATGGGGGTWGSITGTLSSQTDLATALAAKAPLASPTFTGTPTAPTVGTATDSTTKIATTAFVQAALVAYTAPIASDGSGHYIFGGGSVYNYPGPTPATLTVNGDLAVQGPFEVAFVNTNTTGTTDTPWNVNNISLYAADYNRSPAIRFIGDDGYEDGAMGRGNSGPSQTGTFNPWGLYTFMSTSPGYDLTTGTEHNTLPGGLALIWEGMYNGSMAYYRRLEINPNAQVTFNLPPSTQGRNAATPHLQLSAPTETAGSTCNLYDYCPGGSGAAQFTAINNNSHIVGMAIYGNGFSSVGSAFVAETAAVLTNAPNGLNFISLTASPMKFFVGGYASGNEAARFDGSGNFMLGTTSQIAGCLLSVNGWIFGTYIRTTQVAVAALVSAATAGLGARAFVTDATSTLTAGIGATVAGGGSNKVPVYSDGTNWIIG